MTAATRTRGPRRSRGIGGAGAGENTSLRQARNGRNCRPGHRGHSPGPQVMAGCLAGSARRAAMFELRWVRSCSLGARTRAAGAGAAGAGAG